MPFLPGFHQAYIPSGENKRTFPASSGIPEDTEMFCNTLYYFRIRESFLQRSAVSSSSAIQLPVLRE